MSTIFKQECRVYPTGLRLLIVIFLLIGIFFRFVNLDKKVYWHDEVYTSLRISGYTRSELIEQVFNNREIVVEDLQKYQRLNPERNVIDTIKSLALEDPQHPPLYYIILRFWLQSRGQSVAIIRSLSAVISLLVFPAVYWLCLELFSSALVGWVAIALVAVSPIHVLFAQESREYGLWIVTILVSSASLLQAIKLKTKLSWLIYTITTVLSLYTFLLSGLVAIGHGIYLLVIEHFRLTKTVFSYLIASVISILAFAPWLFILITNWSIFQLTTGWTNSSVSLSVLSKYWLFKLNNIFIDVNPEFSNPVRYIIFLPLLIYSLYFLCIKTPLKIWLFVLILIATTALFLAVPDIIKGGIRSIVTRYLFPCFLGIQLAVSYLFAMQISSRSDWKRQIWKFIMSILLFGGIISCTISSQADTWWNKEISYHNPQIARTINQTEKPLVISNSFGINPGNIISLSYLLEPKVKLLLVNEEELPKISEDFSDIFLFADGSDKLRSKLEKKYKIDFVLNNFWRLN